VANKATTATKKAGEGYVRALSEFRAGKLRVTRGQVFKLEGVNSDSLLALRYVLPVEKGTEVIECGTCGALFVNEHWLEIHGDIWHTYECECGWVPQPSASMTKDEQMRRHRMRCPIASAKRDEAHQAHVQAALEQT
jgi:hypothetical protein